MPIAPQPFSEIQDGQQFVLGESLCLKLDATRYVPDGRREVQTIDPSTEVIPRPPIYKLLECERGNRWAKMKWSDDPNQTDVEQASCNYSGCIDHRTSDPHKFRLIRETQNRQEAKAWKRNVKEYSPASLAVDHALNRFAEAAAELNAAWDGLNNESHPIVVFYPVDSFQDDFEDTTRAILEWRDRALGYSEPEFEVIVPTLIHSGPDDIDPARSNHFTNAAIDAGFPDHITRDGRAMFRPKEGEVVGTIKAGPASVIRSLNRARAAIVERREDGTASKVRLLEDYDLNSAGDIIEVDQFEFTEGIAQLGKAGQSGD